MTGVADGWSLPRRACFVGAEQNPAYRPARPPLAGPADGAAQLAQRVVELFAAADRQLLLLAVQNTVGEGVFAGCVRGIGLLEQMDAADHAVLMIAQQGLNRLGALRNPGFPGGRRDVTQSLGGLADSV